MCRCGGEEKCVFFKENVGLVGLICFGGKGRRCLIFGWLATGKEGKAANG